jgi:glycosyltransferase involved in cell wall biosynthesis
MRVLLVSGSAPPMRCGVGDYTAALARALGEQGDVTAAILTSVEAVSTAAAGYTVLPVARGWRVRDAASVTRAISAWKPDVVHVQYPTQGYRGGVLPWVLPTMLTGIGYPVVQTWHEAYRTLRASKRNWPNALLRGTLVVVRPPYLDMISRPYRWLLERTKRLTVIPNGSPLPILDLTDADRMTTRSALVDAGERLLVYFGFAYPSKGVELLFEIADPARDRIVLACDLHAHDPYHRSLRARAEQGPWRGRVHTAGFLAPDALSRLLGSADAVILPFRDGGGSWNTSIHGAAAQGTFVLTTAAEGTGYDATENVYWARPGASGEMRDALSRYAGRRRPAGDDGSPASWRTIAERHVQEYQRLVR